MIGGASDSSIPLDSASLGSGLISLVLEKLPLFALAALSCFVTFYAQQSEGAIRSVIPIFSRIVNALVSYLLYLGKAIWPTKLAFFYPYPETIPLWKVFGVGVLLLFISILIIKRTRRQAYLVTGWFWYLGTLVPVIGLVQVGSQAMADRYTYVPLIGIFFLTTWGIADLANGLRYRRHVLATSAVAVLLALMIGAYWQVQHWRNSITLFQHAPDVTTENWMAHYNLGTVLSKQGKVDEAIVQYSSTVMIRPRYIKAYNNLGNALVRQGKYEEAITHYSRALQIDPRYPELHNNLGNVLARMERFSEAIDHYRKALRIRPDYEAARRNMEIAQQQLRKRSD